LFGSIATTEPPMRAFLLDRYGGPESARLAEVPRPEPRDRDVLIHVHAAGLNPVDYKIREGKLKPITDYSLPVVLGNELSGTVIARGAAATRFAIGDAVFARVAKDRLGAFAEYACVDEDCVARVPSSIDLVHAAAVPLAALTAMQCLRDELALQRGQRLLVNGGAGGVGTFAIPLARLFGLDVTATASARGADLVRSLGANRVIDYTTTPLASLARDFDGALDLVGGDSLSALFALVKPGGAVVSIAGLPEPQTARKDLGRGSVLAFLFWMISFPLRQVARRNGVRYRYKFMHPSGTELTELAQLIDAGTLPVTVDRVFPFAQIADAFAYLEQGRAKGKVVVRMID
jgi:alcohol dehydrogenase